MPSRPRLVKSHVKNPVRESSRPVNRNDTYGTIHQKLRQQVLDNNPFCVRCRVRFSEHAHHLVYPATCEAEYEALCKICHSAEHNSN